MATSPSVSRSRLAVRPALRVTSWRRGGIDKAVNESEATNRAKVLNAELGAAHEPNDYYVPVQGADGDWQVERRSGEPIKTSRRERAFDWVVALLLG